MDMKTYYLIFGLILFIVILSFLTFYRKLKLENENLNSDSEKINDALNQVKKENKQLVQEVTHNRSTDNAQAAFYTAMSYQMQSSVQAILGTTVIAKNNEKNPGRLADCHHRIESNAKYLSSLLENVAAYSKVISTENFTTESLSLRDCLQDYVKATQLSAEEQAVSVALHDFTEFMPPRVLSVPSYLNHIFSVILQNAVQYNKANGKISVKAEVLSTSEDSILCQFTVSDTGIGMSQDFLSHLFDPFTQENAKLFEAYHNTGLSLSIVKEMVTKLNGEIKCKSQQGIGSEFIVTLPFYIDKKYVPEAEADFSCIRILLADGNPLSRELISHRLKEVGMIVDIAEDGRIAVNKLERSKKDYYQFILMDTEIPIMDGAEATRCIRSLNHPDAQSVPIIGMSRHTLDVDCKAFLDAGMNTVLEKPLDISHFMEIVKGEA